MIKIKTLENTNFQIIHEAAINAFSDYVEQFEVTLEELKYMLERRGCNLSLSFGAFDGDKLVGFTLNGVGEWNGQRTAYDTGTGVIKEYRKQGIATRIFNESLPVLRENKITQYLLEVIKTNTGAFDLYKKAGFKVTREFDYFSMDKDKIEIKREINQPEFQIKKVDKPNWEIYKTLWEFNPSWQNSIDSINRKIEHFDVQEVIVENELAGYGIIERHTGDIPSLAISPNRRRNKIGKILFNKLLEHTDSNEIRITNSAKEYKPFKSFVENLGLPAGYGQYEMILKL